jgi:hypothetical protein
MEGWSPGEIGLHEEFGQVGAREEYNAGCRCPSTQPSSVAVQEIVAGKSKPRSTKTHGADV